MGWHGLSIIGVAHLPAGRAAILGFIMPVFTVLLSVLVYGERFTTRLALAGAAMWGVLSWSVLLNYGAAQVIWFAMARTLPASTSAMSVTAIPIVGILSSMLIGEQPSWQDGLAVVCVVVAIGAVLLRRR